MGCVCSLECKSRMLTGCGSGGEFVSLDAVLTLAPARYALATAHAKHEILAGHVSRRSTECPSAVEGA